ncbi:uncharacterized protein LOC107036031 [Diachasma alloeum]|uniref:uncharacterized protein LOC107036031 n=1 Tax=Diachasma alloeum TaxID=454923 RepID=UPI0007381C2F|nr:uncharacterized protein LOC107036031 [Diachasma alloeum]XP_015109227.1 uncharacterized protein LOC107036031 [Diachasma alloeum]
MKRPHLYNLLLRPLTTSRRGLHHRTTRNASTNPSPPPRRRVLEHLRTRSLISLRGPDTPDFLQGLITNDMRHFAEGIPNIYSLFLNTKGRVLYDTIIYKSPEEDVFLLEVDASISADLQRHLKMYKIRRKVDITPLGESMKVWAAFVTDFDPQNMKNVEKSKFEGRIFPCGSLTNTRSELIGDVMIFKDPRIPSLGMRILGHENVSGEEIARRLGLEGSGERKVRGEILGKLGFGGDGSVSREEILEKLGLEGIKDDENLVNRDIFKKLELELGVGDDEIVSKREILGKLGFGGDGSVSREEILEKLRLEGIKDNENVVNRDILKKLGLELGVGDDEIISKREVLRKLGLGGCGSVSREEILEKLGLEGIKDDENVVNRDIFKKLELELGVGDDEIISKREVLRKLGLGGCGSVSREEILEKLGLEGIRDDENVVNRDIFKKLGLELGVGDDEIISKREVLRKLGLGGCGSVSREEILEKLGLEGIKDDENVVNRDIFKKLGLELGVGDDERVSKREVLRKLGLEDDEEMSYKEFRYRLGIGEGVEDLPPGKPLPLEVNCDYLHGVSFHKGCYIGQELTARTHHTGVVRKRLMPLVFDDVPGGRLEVDESVLGEGGKAVGKLKGVEGRFGLGLMRIAEALAGGGLRVGGTGVKVVKPCWWPVDSPKEKSVN